tara:strand:+ start:852 stop:1181 length:330 start_codon:yes stop_codon:yes gene_type:complete
MAKETMKDKLDMMDAKIEHIEDINADNRVLIVKLVKQNNEIIQYLKQFEIEEVTDNYGYNPIDNKKNIKMDELKALIKEFKSKSKEMKEFEKEMEKHKGMLTPGEFGEA